MTAARIPKSTLHPDRLVKVSDLPADLKPEVLAGFAQEVVTRVARRLKGLPTPEDTSDLARALVEPGPEPAADLVSEWLANGVSETDLIERQLASAARLLGTWWDEDRVSFVEVTIGSARILRILQHLRPPPAPFAPHMMLATVPGENHTLGATAAAAVIAQAGWDVTLRLGLSKQALLLEIVKVKPPVIGLSASSEIWLPELLSLLAALRAEHPELTLLVGGPLAALRETEIRAAGADCTVTAAETALELLLGLAQKNHR